MPKYRKKPVVIEAIQWTGENLREVLAFTGINRAYFGWPESAGKTHYGLGRRGEPESHLWIRSLEGDHRAEPGDFVIRGVQGEFCPCKPDIFEATYEPVTDKEEGK